MLAATRETHAGPAGIVGATLLLLASLSDTLVNETSHFIGEAGLPGILLLMAASFP